MADISKTASHSVDTEVLRQRLDELAKKISDKFGLKYSWEGDVCTLKGSALKSGYVSMDASSVKIELTLGMMAKMFKGQIEQEVDKWIERVTTSDA